ncbi:MAG: efflux RND transporter periplasmic adaptor subunit [Verrucomicrobiota bacterium]|nr:efflux RND transporter periplasmic adaptor subunit [Verrucomicrobiota bacterium]
MAAATQRAANAQNDSAPQRTGRAASLADEDTNVVTVQTEMVTNQFEGYAQVEPIAMLPVRAAESGMIARLRVVPGDTVTNGEPLGRMGGPEIKALLAQDEGNARSAQTNLLTARKALAIEREQLRSHLASRQMVFQAENTEARAESAFLAAQAALKALRQTIVLAAPADGMVLALNAAEGERVMPGDTILTMQATHHLWLKASLYGPDIGAIHPGMSGRFFPANGAESIPVKVISVSGALSPDGGQFVGMAPLAASPPWLNGEAGSITLNGTARSLVAVPTRALILDKGQWWVLAHAAKGDVPQAVVPGPARGWQTFIESGLKPGTRIVAQNAYLEFHRSIARSYRPPD